MYNKLIIPIVLLFLAFACRRPDHTAQGADTLTTLDTAAGMVVADTIIYDVLIQNPNPEDPWAVQCLKGLNHSLFIDNIFTMIYSGKLTPYNHETREKLTSAQVQKMETAEGFDRDNIGMIQFTEVWYMNPVNGTMTKKVHSMVLGYNYYTPDGERFHKALFRVEMGK
ncbi:MAG: hypothetical protein JW830_15080 [Bacteroidales bacterium]|nr:hypothetical protein [Bacteroidales bacterium]